MKYIRTEDGILKVDGYDNSGTCVIRTNTYSKTYYKEDYIKMADTIEELCDEFVCVSKDNPKDYIIDDNLWGDVYPYYNPEKDYLFGAIITDKGLIYVAKMNDKGELELI